MWPHYYATRQGGLCLNPSVGFLKLKIVQWAHLSASYLGCKFQLMCGTSTYITFLTFPTTQKVGRWAIESLISSNTYHFTTFTAFESYDPNQCFPSFFILSKPVPLSLSLPLKGLQWFIMTFTGVSSPGRFFFNLQWKVDIKGLCIVFWEISIFIYSTLIFGQHNL